MTTPCLRVDDAARYVAGTLPADAIDAFEEHLLACAVCQGEVRVGAAARLGLRGSAEPLVAPLPAPDPARGSARLRARALAVLGVAAAAVLVLTVQARRNAPLRALAAYSPPVFVGATVRAASDSGDSERAAARVDLAMAAYAAGDFRVAAARLNAAATADSTAGVAFYLGAAQLASGDARGAIAAFRRAAAVAGNPYAEDAAVGAAKAFLRLGLADSALAVLANPAVGAAPAVQALADSIRSRRR